FPVIASFYWKKVTNKAFTISVLAALVVFLPVRFQLIPLTGAWALFVELLAIVGVGVVLGIMSFGFFGLRPAVIIGAVASLAVLPFGFGYLRDFETLSGSLVAYSVSFLVCYLLSVRSSQNFDYSVIKRVTGDFDDETPTSDEDVVADGDGDTVTAARGADD
ncbi:MAG: sodium:proline symporter, partial [Dermabacteraceae bacterium]